MSGLVDCAKCGRAAPDDGRFCPWCGAALGEDPATRPVDRRDERDAPPARERSTAKSGRRRSAWPVVAVIGALATTGVAVLLATRERQEPPRGQGSAPAAASSAASSAPVEQPDQLEQLEQRAGAGDASAARQAIERHEQRLREDGALASLPSLGRLHARVGEPEEAARWLDAALAVEGHAAAPERVDLLLDSANAHALAGHASEARARVDEALRLAPDDARALANRGVLALWRGDVEAAERDLSRAVLLQPDLAEPRAALATALRAQGRLAEARAQAEEAVRILPSCAPAHVELGLLAEDAGDFAAAREHHARAVAALPGDVVAAANLARVEARLHAR
jgi:tetratricopeptide (TPR) repeat protein